MSNTSRISVALLCALIAGSMGCRGKQPVVAPGTKSSDATKTSEGPLLAPPKQQTAPTSPQGADHAAIPTEGKPDGQPASKTAATSPTDGVPSGNEKASSAAQPVSADKEAAAKIKANLALLSTEDRALAEKQKICPVSGELLGAMGAPKKISVAGHDVFICCKSCEEPLTQEPAKFLAKIGLEPAK